MGLYKSKNFSLIELMVVFAIMAILVTLLQPSMRRLVSHNNTNLCKNKLRSVYAGITLFTESNDGTLPGPSWASQSPRALNANGYVSKNLAGNLYPFFLLQTDTAGNQFLNELICPSSQELELIPSVESRTQFIVNGKNVYFGYPKTSYSGPETSPKKFNQVSSPSTFWAITDADRKNAGWLKAGYAPDLPLHTDISRNYLYFDGHIDNLIIP